jgi:hypothetical protein
MKRLLALWLTLLAAFWLTRTAVSALLFQRADRGYGTLVQLVAIPVLQAVMVGWLTRAAWPSSWKILGRELLQRRLLLGMLVADAAVLLLAVTVENEAPPAAWAGLQAGAAGVLFALLARGAGWTRRERGWFWITAGLLAAAALFSIPMLPTPEEILLPDRSEILHWVLVELPLSALLAGVLLWVQPMLGRRRLGAAAALDAAVGLGLLASLLDLPSTVPPQGSDVAWEPLAWLCRLAAATALVAAALVARDAPPLEEAAFDPAPPAP